MSNGSNPSSTPGTAPGRNPNGSSTTTTGEARLRELLAALYTLRGKRAPDTIHEDADGTLSASYGGVLSSVMTEYELFPDGYLRVTRTRQGGDDGNAVSQRCWRERCSRTVLGTFLSLCGLRRLVIYSDS